MNDNPFEPAPSATPEQPVQPVNEPTPILGQQPASEPAPILGQQPAASESAPIIGGASNQQQASVVDAMHAANAPHQKKKWLVPAIIGGLLAVAAAVVLVIILNNGGGNGGDQRGGGAPKTQTFFNKNKADSDSLGFVFGSKTYDGKKLLIGIRKTDLAKDLKFGSMYFENDKKNGIGDFDYLDEINIRYDGNTIIDTEFDSIYYQEKDGKKTYPSEDIVYESGDYLVEKTSLNSYHVHYKLSTATYSYGAGSYHVLRVAAFLPSLEKAKERVELLKSIMYYCQFTEDEGVSKCENYQSYNYAQDLVMEELNKYGLYLSSYDEIYSYNNDKVTVKKMIDERYSKSTDFVIGFRNVALKESEISGYEEFEMNGRKFYHKNGAILTEKDGMTVAIAISLDYDIEDTSENYINEFKSVFGS